MKYYLIETALDESKEPKTKPTKINANLEAVIIQTRQKLVKRDEPQTRYAYHGAIAIHQKLDEMGYVRIPVKHATRSGTNLPLMFS